MPAGVAAVELVVAPRAGVERPGEDAPPHGTGTDEVGLGDVLAVELKGRGRGKEGRRSVGGVPARRFNGSRRLPRTAIALPE